MELFLPGLLVLVVAAFFIFLVLPRMGSVVLVVVSLVALIAAGIHHYSMFHSEYSLSTWQYGLQSYAPWVVLGLALVFIVASLFFVFGGASSSVMNAVSTPMEAIQNAVLNSTETMPSNSASATNPLTAAINSGLNTLLNTSKNTSKSNTNTSPLLPGLNFPASQV
jgi:hypothetical protein